MAGLWNTCMAEWALREGVRCYIAFFLFSLFLEINRVALPAPPPHIPPYFAVLPQLVALHAVAVIEGDWAGVGDGIEAELLGVLGVARPDVLSPGEGEHLDTQEHRDRDGKARGFVVVVDFCNYGTF